MSAANSSEILEYSGQDGEVEEADSATIKNLSGNTLDENASDLNGHGDYSARMDEIFSDNGSDDGRDWHSDEPGQDEHDEDDEDDEGFIYTGKDAEEPSGGYREQLKDVLDGDELDSDDGAFDNAYGLADSLHQLRDFHEANEHVHVVR